jgi:hypothetical protein
LTCDLIDDEDVAAEWTTTLVDKSHDGAVSRPVRDLVRRVMCG